jgi:hypothetical protein
VTLRDTVTRLFLTPRLPSFIEGSRFDVAQNCG